MITLIAESKTMNLSQIPASSIKNLLFTPFEDEAFQINEFVKTLTTQELSQRLSASGNIAIKSSCLAYEFPNKSLGNLALFAFTGEVFKALDAKSFTDKQLEFANQKLMIISSLYGLLSPKDFIKPYRLDFSAQCSPDGEPLTNFWRKRLTIAFAKWLKENKEKEILNLLPTDASKYIDWKIIKSFAKVEKPDFKIITESATLKTPNAGKLKELRGKMGRTVIDLEIDTLSAIRNLSTPYFIADTEEPRPGATRFLLT